jgi:hypothetical protein
MDDTRTACGCYRCLFERRDSNTFMDWGGLTLIRMVVCEMCGNKRCPHSDDHRNACTGSNEPGQHGSRYV